MHRRGGARGAPLEPDWPSQVTQPIYQTLIILCLYVCFVWVNRNVLLFISPTVAFILPPGCDAHLGHLHGVGQHLHQRSHRQRLLQDEAADGQVGRYILQASHRHAGEEDERRSRANREEEKALTWALDVVSKKQSRFPKPSQDRHSLICCSFRMEAVHCRTTWSSCRNTHTCFIYVHAATPLHLKHTFYSVKNSPSAQKRFLFFLFSAGYKTDVIQTLHSLYEKNVYIKKTSGIQGQLFKQHRTFQTLLFSRSPGLKVEPFSSTEVTQLKCSGNVF